jgi:hypothetical protein
MMTILIVRRLSWALRVVRHQSAYRRMTDVLGL